jgi:hypothetical protein
MNFQIRFSNLNPKITIETILFRKNTTTLRTSLFLTSL